MPFIGTFKYDVFVSYSSADNDPAPSVELGWVSTFVKGLGQHLKRAGKKDVSIFQDRKELPLNGELPENLQTALESTGVLVILLSTAYLASDWCRREREIFCAKFAGPDLAKRIFVVRLDDSESPHELKEIVGRVLWSRDPDNDRVRLMGYPAPRATDTDYFYRVSDVGQDVARELQRLRDAPPPPDPKTVPRPSHVPSSSGRSRAVYLAEVTDDLDDRREQVRRSLEQEGVRVLPQRLYSREPDEYRALLQEDLSASCLFVQLVGAVVGKKHLQLAQGYARFQREIVGDALEVLQWRDPLLDLKSITDPGQREFVDGPRVQAVTLEDFKRMVIERYRVQIAPPPPSQRSRFIYLNADDADEPVVQGLIERCKALQYGFMQAAKGSPTEMTADLERAVNMCDAIVVVYDSSDKFWVRAKMLELFPRIQLRPPPQPALAIFQKPPPPVKAEIQIGWPGLKYLRSEADLATLFAGEG